jgi:hypothetical protein
MLLTFNETEYLKTKNILQIMCNNCAKINLKYIFKKTAAVGHSGSDGPKDRDFY